MKKTEAVVFMATPAQRKRIDDLAALLGKNTSAVMRDLIDAATVTPPVIVFKNLGQTNSGERVQHGA